MNKSDVIGSICLITASGIWGGMYVVSKFAMNFVDPFVLMWLRFAIATVVLCPILMFVYKTDKIKKKDLLLIAGLAFIGYFVSNTCAFIGVHLSSAHMGSLLSATSPVFTLLFAFWILKEKLPVKKLVSVSIAIAGIILVVGYHVGETRTTVIGNVVLLGDAVSWGLYSVFLKKISSRIASLVISTYATLATLLYTTPLMLWKANSTLFIQLQRPEFLLVLLYLGVIATALAFFLWNKGMAHLEAGYGMMFYFFTPVTGSVFGWMFLNEKLQLNFILGALLVIIGMAVAMYPEPTPKFEEQISVDGV